MAVQRYSAWSFGQHQCEANLLVGRLSLWNVDDLKRNRSKECSDASQHMKTCSCISHLAAHGTDEDDAARLVVLDHGSGRLSSSEEAAIEVDVHELLVLVGRVLQSRVVVHDAS